MGKKGNGTGEGESQDKTLAEVEEEGSDHSNGKEYEPLTDPDAPIDPSKPKGPSSGGGQTI